MVFDNNYITGCRGLATLHDQTIAIEELGSHGVSGDLDDITLIVRAFRTPLPILRIPSHFLDDLIGWAGDHVSSDREAVVRLRSVQKGAVQTRNTGHAMEFYKLQITYGNF